jgi:tetratricopeptide (TPR) repeat protein
MPRTRTWLTAGALVALTLAAYLPLWHNGYIDYDDELYITDNPRVTEGLTVRGFSWAWTTLHGKYWQPLSWLSLQADAEFFSTSSAGARRPSAAAVHGESLGWHAASALLLFGLLRRVTGAPWRSFLAAALFAVHPMHVESVAWAAERKDVLSVFFGLLTLWAYVSYVAAPAPRRYVAVLLTYALSLLAKPMLITLPFALLLLDYWPLRRLGAAGAAGAVPFRRLLREKLPLFLLAGGIATATFAARTEMGSAVSLQSLSLSARLANAASACTWYLSHTAWPRDLAVLYPHPLDNWHWPPVLGGVAVLLGGTLAAVWQWRRSPWLAVGWFWFVGALLPVSGLAQGGMQAWADRFTYWPHVGLFTAGAWALGELAGRLRIPAAAVGGASALLLAVLAALTWVQVGYWRDPPTLWEHALAVTEDNLVAHEGLTVYHLKKNRPDRAAVHAAEAVRIRPESVDVHCSLGVALLALGLGDEAAAQFRDTVRLAPGCADGWHNLGVARLRQGRPDLAARSFRQALDLQPDSPDTLANLGQALWQNGERREGLRVLQAALAVNPGSADAWNGLGIAHLTLGRPRDAAEAFGRALGLYPGLVGAHSNLGLALGRQGQWAEAVACHRRAVALQEEGEERLRALGGRAPAPESIPQVVIYRCRLAFALDRIGDRAGADEAYRAALERDPEWPQAFLTKAHRLTAHPDEDRRDPLLADELTAQAARAAACAEVRSARR